MRPSPSIVLVLSLVSTSVAAAAGPLPIIGGDPVRGRDAFVESGCLACHAVNGAGGTIGPDLAVALVGKGMLSISAAMLSHFPQMLAARADAQGPSLPTLAPTELDDIIAYLFAINFVEEPGSVQRGRQVFNEAGCASCHGPNAHGPRAARTLGRASIDASAIAIAQSMWNHGARMWRQAEASGIPRRQFKPGEFVDLLAFLGAHGEPLHSGEGALPGDPRVGREVFHAKGCTRCHVGGDAEVAGQPHRATEGWYQTPSEIAAAMWNHGPAMWQRMETLGMAPVQLGDDDMANVISFFYVLRSTGEVGDAARGATVLEQKHCTRCHGIGRPAPALTGLPDLETPIHFAAVMWNHGPRMHELLTKEGLEWPTFSDEDVRDVVAYLHAPKPGGAAQSP
jgi:cytochrome c2